MPHYRLYLLDADRQEIIKGTDVECFDDDAAFLAARTEIDDAFVIEVWSGARRVGRVSGAAR